MEEIIIYNLFEKSAVLYGLSLMRHDVMMYIMDFAAVKYSLNSILCYYYYCHCNCYSFFYHLFIYYFLKNSLLIFFIYFFFLFLFHWNWYFRYSSLNSLDCNIVISRSYFNKAYRWLYKSVTYRLCARFIVLNEQIHNV